MIHLKDILNNLDYSFNQIKKRNNQYLKDLQNLIDIYKKRNLILKNIEDLKFKRNEISKKISKLSKNKIEIIKESKEIGIQILNLEQKIIKFELKLKELIYKIPNIPHKSVKVGFSPADNEIVFISKEKLKKTDTSHDEIAKKLNWVQFEEAVNLTQSRFILYINEGAKMLRVLKNYMLDYHIKNSYIEIFAPNVIKESGLWGTGQFPKMKDDCYKLENEDLYLLPTSEVSLVNYSAKKTFKEQELPLKFCSYSLCFRKEAGASGLKTKGLIRLHQFNKVEIVQITKQEESYNALEQMLKQVTGILKELKIPYRVLNLCAGDLGFSSSKTYDVEAWMPSKNKYVEISSISNTETFQSNALNIKYIDINGKKKLVHTLNGSGLAIDRLIAVLLENYYDEKNNVFIWPDVLKKYI